VLQDLHKDREVAIGRKSHGSSAGDQFVMKKDEQLAELSHIGKWKLYLAMLFSE
jgi:hypothetical protein